MTGVSLSASRRAQIEGVRVLAQSRGQGIGTALPADAERRARAAGCTGAFSTNRRRGDAHRFHARAGCVAFHFWFKTPL